MLRGSRCSLHVLRCGLFVAVVVDVEFHYVLVRIGLVERGLHAFVHGHPRQDVQAFEPSVGAQQIVQCLVFKGDVLLP